MPPAPVIRPMVPGDARAVHALGMRTLFTHPPDVAAAVLEERMVLRFEQLLALDPGGSYVAETGDEIAGVAMSLVREGVWGLSLFAVDEAVRHRGLGRRLLDAAHAYGEERGAHGWIVLSSEHPGAMRLYAHHLGMDVHPSVAAVGIPVLDDAPALAVAVRDAGPADIALADAIGRELRGAGHGPDLEGALGIPGFRLLVLEDRAFALARENATVLVGGRDEEAATAVLWGAWLSAPRGSTAIVTFVTGAQQWAVRACLQARLPLSLDSPVMTRGRLGPLHPYLPSGAWL